MPPAQNPVHRVERACALPMVVSAVVGARTFANIADKWELSEQERLQVLGMAKDLDPTQETLERVSHILVIYRQVQTLLGHTERADRWMRATNTAPPFSGRSPIELVIGGEILAVRRYLDAQIEPSFT